MRIEETSVWVVYKMTLGALSRNAVCTQTEWDLMEASAPGYHTLIREQIVNEGEAERLARDLQTIPKPSKRLYTPV